MPSSQPTSVLRRPRTHEGMDTEVLAARWRNEHDEHARDILVERFMPMARRLARRYHSPHEPLDDLLQVACLGLVAAINRYDPGRGTSFPSYAIPTILGELKRHFRNTGWAVHVPRGAQEMALRVDRASRGISERWGRDPTVAEIAEYLEVSPEAVLDGLEAGTGHYAASLDAPISNAEPDDPACLSDTIGRTDDGYGFVEAMASFDKAVRRLPYLERRALKLRLSRAMKQTDIARELGCSQMQISRLLRRAGRQMADAIQPQT